MPAFDDGDTVAAIATPPGRGAVAIVRLSGSAARAVASRIFRTPRPLVARVATLGDVVDAAGVAIDRGLALIFPAPHSYTGEDVVELHVHGSPAIARETLLAALAAGARAATPGEFTRRAYLRGKLDLTAAEAVNDLIEAEGRSAARAALARLSGGLAAEVDARRATLDDIAEELAASLDFPDEVDAPDAAALARRLDDLDAGLGELAATWETGLVLREGVAIAIVGPPNAGKSSLLNALLGSERALVSEAAGTTRDTIEETLALGGGLAARIIDTAGLRASDDPLEAAGIARSERALAAATIVLVVVDGSQPLGAEARSILVRTRARERVAVFNKSDLGRAGFDQRDPAEAAALSGCARDPHSVARIRAALATRAGADRVDLARPHLGTARQADAVLEARRSLALARATLAAGDPIDLVAHDLVLARAALAGITDRDADETLLDAIFARFCIGK